jgi:hypothetical protein
MDRHYWIGGTRAFTSSNVWTWDHGESWSYTNNNTYENHLGLCMLMYTNKYNSINVWYDNVCSITQYYICENGNKCPSGYFIYIIYIRISLHIISNYI